MEVVKRTYCETDIHNRVVVCGHTLKVWRAGSEVWGLVCLGGGGLMGDGMYETSNASYDQGRVVRDVSASVFGKGMLRSGYRLE